MKVCLDNLRSDNNNSLRLKAGGEGDDRGWDGWLASPTRWTWVWVSSGSWWWTGKPGRLQSMGSQRVRHDWVTELNGTEMLVAQLCLTLCDPWTVVCQAYSSIKFSVTRIPEPVAIPFSRESSRSRDQTQAFHTAGRFFTIRATWETNPSLNFLQQSQWGLHSNRPMCIFALSLNITGLENMLKFVAVFQRQILSHIIKKKICLQTLNLCFWSNISWKDKMMNDENKIWIASLN